VIVGTLIVRSLLSGCIAALLSYYISSKALKLAGDMVIIYLSPILEELFKTAFALLLEGGIFLSHATFGAIESVYDIWTNEGGSAYWAGIASIVSHGAFGAITQLVISRTGSSFLGIAAAVLIHTAWNYKVIGFKNRY
jgi:hypothetical protein